LKGLPNAQYQKTVSDVQILVAGNCPLTREGIVQVLTRAGIQVVAQAASAADLLSQGRIHRPDIIVADIGPTPACADDSLRTALMLREENPALGVLFLSQYVEAVCAQELFKAGASGIGYLLRDRVDNIDRFVDSVRQVGNGGSVLDPDVVALLVGRQQATASVDSLTGRERSVITLMAEARSNNAIARSLHVSEASVEKHIRSIFIKLRLSADPDTHRRVLAVLTYLQGL
jgi:DNA-binding NarL/FixJ family response regulator